MRVETVIKIIRKLYEGLISFLTLGIITFLLFLGSRTTAVLTQSEHLLFIEESPLSFLFWIMAAVVVAFLFTRFEWGKELISKINTDEKLYRRVRTYLAFGLFSVCLFWVLSTQMMARGDQLEIQEAAFRVHLGDFGELLPDGYIGAHYNQIGLMLISYLFSFIFGSQNYLVFQIFNCVAVAVIYVRLADLGAVIKLSNFNRLLVQVSGFFFLPIIFFSSFVYGNIIGLALALCALNYEYRFFEEKKKRYAFASALLIALATMVKPNFAIYMIGILGFAVLSVIIKKDVKSLYYVALVLIFFALQTYGTKFVFEKMSGLKLQDGISPYAFVAMGLQEGGLGPGWYDGYNDLSYEIVKYDTKAQRQEAIWNIKDRLKFFLENKEEAFSFFTRKTAAQWVEPTYESIFILNEDSDYTVKISAWVWWIISVSGSSVISRLGKIFQILVLFGALLFMLLFRRDGEYYKALTPLMILFGGFAFHFVWEANGQYTIIFFVLLIPFAVSGYAQLSELIAGMGKAGEFKVALNRLSLIIAAIFFIGFTVFYHGRSQYLAADTESYKAYVQASKEEVVIPDSTYNLKSESDLYVTAVPDPDKEYSFDDDDKKMYLNLSSEATAIRLINYHGRVRLYIADKNLYLDHGSEPLIATTYRDTDDQLWIIKPSDTDSQYYIIPCSERINTFDNRMSITSDYHLGYDASGNLVITDDSTSGLWTFEQ
ncbi:hypothetical protein [Butyrivibrio sp. AE2015]|uniref:hypothetical protein n=1 Tax=Butyrivibrio sp. AE2015 TaxID=1280663 RepID=UPI0018CB73B0|nr:hypothetical protein [Butyrivibrio sp. AE2015]